VKRSGVNYADFSGGILNFVIRGKTPGDCETAPGCKNCYALTLMERYGWGPKVTTCYPGKLAKLSTVRFEEKGQPFRRGPGTRPILFPCDLGDLFHPRVPDDFILEALQVMIGREDCDWLILTKRISRARLLFERYLPGRPPRHLWIGTSISIEEDAETRLADLYKIMAPIRWVSYEPALGPVDWHRWLRPNGKIIGPSLFGSCLSPIDWLVCGGESGSRRRPFNKDWARAARDACQENNVAFFYKQGSHVRPGQDRELDGRTWSEYPC